MKKDPFNRTIFLKKIVVTGFGIISYPRFNWINKNKITGTENLDKLPQNNILFVSNHQTYFADTSFLIHTFHSARKKTHNSIKTPHFFWPKFTDLYFVAAEETMKTGILPKLMAFAGAITIKRTWREAGKEIKRTVKFSDISNIGKALDSGWVITFPQGTTTPFAPGRKGTAHIIKKFQPIVVPVVIDGFRRAFDKRGLLLKKKGATLKVNIKNPLNIDYDNDSVDDIMQKVMYSIEQSEEFNWKPKV